METSAFEPSFGAYVGYFVGFAMRYFALAGVIYAVLRFVFRDRLLGYRIQHRLPFPAAAPSHTRSAGR